MEGFGGTFEWPESGMISSRVSEVDTWTQDEMALKERAPRPSRFEDVEEAQKFGFGPGNSMEG